MRTVFSLMCRRAAISVIVETFSKDFQDLSLARREIAKKRQSPVVGRVHRQEIAERANELLPRRLRIQNETIATFQRAQSAPPG